MAQYTCESLGTIRKLLMTMFLIPLVNLAIVHGASGPKFFATPVLDYLFDVEGTDAQLENVPDFQIQGKIKKVSCSGSEEGRTLDL